MRLEVRSGDLNVAEGVKGSLERRLRFVLGRFGNQIGRVTVHLTEMNGSQVETGHRCRIVVHVGAAGRVLVEDTDTDLGAVVNRTVDRVGQVVLRELARRHERAGRTSRRQ